MFKWGDVGIRGEVAGKVLNLINEWYSDEDDLQEVIEKILYEDIYDIEGLATKEQWQEFFEIMELKNIDLLYEGEDVQTGITRLIVNYLVKEDKYEIVCLIDGFGIVSFNKVPTECVDTFMANKEAEGYLYSIVTNAEVKNIDGNEVLEFIAYDVLKEDCED